jgi:hypothetical protein
MLKGVIIVGRHGLHARRPRIRSGTLGKDPRHTDYQQTQQKCRERFSGARGRKNQRRVARADGLLPRGFSERHGRTGAARLVHQRDQEAMVEKSYGHHCQSQRQIRHR